MLTEGKGTLEEQERTKEFAKAVFASRAQREAEEAARSSEQRSFDDGAGTVWAYVVYDGVEVRIVGCASGERAISVPEVIEGWPVRVIESDSMGALEAVEEVSIPECVTAIRPYAFRGCASLKKVVMACMVNEYDPTWFRGCDNVEALYLPHGITEVKPNVFDLPRLRVLHLGKSLQRIEPGMFAKSKLEEFHISPKNEVFSTDGTGIYSKDGRVFIALARPVEEYVVADGVVEIAKKAASNFSCVKRIELPDTVEKLDDYALSRSGITEFVAPASLVSMGSQALCNCRDLVRVELNEGLSEIGEEAFLGTSIEKLHVPKSIRVLGSRVVARTPLVFSGPEATFTIDKDCPTLKLDAQGCLYRTDGDEVRLIRILEPGIDKVAVAEGTTVIGAGAFYKHAALEAVKFPEGLKVVEEDAFSGCRSLAYVKMASTVARIEKNAFVDTALVEFEIPTALEYLGETALITAGAHHDEGLPSIRKITVAEGQSKFYKAGGLLCERMDDGSSKLLVYDQSDPVVRIPDEVTTVAPYAMNGTSGIREFRISDHVRSIAVRGLGFECHIKDVYMETSEPVEGCTEFHFEFPNTMRGIRQLGNAFGVMKCFSLESVYRCYDLTITNSSSFDLGDECVDELYSQIKLILKRLENKIYMSSVTSDTINKMFAHNMDEICKVAGLHSDLDVVEGMNKNGFITRDTILKAIEGAGLAGSAALEERLRQIAVEDLGIDLEELEAEAARAEQERREAEEEAAKAKAKEKSKNAAPRKYVRKHALDDPSLRKAIFG